MLAEIRPLPPEISSSKTQRSRIVRAICGQGHVMFAESQPRPAVPRTPISWV